MRRSSLLLPGSLAGGLALLLASLLGEAGAQTITTVAGTGVATFGGDDGPGASAQLNTPHGVAVDASGNLFIAEVGNHRIRKVDAQTGIITTVAGTGAPGFSGDGGPATSAQLDEPSGVALNRIGSLFVADCADNRIRKVQAGPLTQGGPPAVLAPAEGATLSLSSLTTFSWTAGPGAAFDFFEYIDTLAYLGLPMRLDGMERSGSPGVPCDMDSGKRWMGVGRVILVAMLARLPMGSAAEGLATSVIRVANARATGTRYMGVGPA